MAKPEWGTKHTCSSCGKTFYDMQRSPIICPACGTENSGERLLKSRRTDSKASKPAPVVAVVKTETEEGILLDDDAILKEDDADTEDDAEGDDISVVVAPTPKGDE